MDSARPGNSKPLLSLQDAAQQLGVSVDVLLHWNEHNILKPILTPSGYIAYSKEQIDQFALIRQAALQRSTEQPVVTVQTQPAVEVTLPSPHHTTISPRLLATLGGILGVVVISVLIYQASMNSVTRFETPQSTEVSKTEPTDNGKTSVLSLSGQTRITPTITLSKDAVLAKNLRAEGADVLSPKPFTHDILAASSSVSSPETSEQEALAGLSDKTNNADDIPGLSVFSSRGNCPSCSDQTATTNTLAFDESGNIKGDVKEDAFPSTLDRIGLGATQETVHTTSPGVALQLMVLMLGAGLCLYLMRSQLPFAFTPTQKSATQPLFTSPSLTEKILEITQKTDGTVLLHFQGKAFKVSKPELYSESDQFFERLMTLSENGQKELEYDSSKDEALKLTTPLSRLVTRLGFVGVKRDLFFPRTSKQVVLFRPRITKQDIIDMSVTEEQILAELTATA